MGQPWQDSPGMAAGTGEPGHVNLDQAAWTGELGQNREDKSGHDSNARTAASGKLWTRLLDQDSWHRTSGIGQPGRDSQERTVGTGQPEETVRTVHQDRKQRPRLPEQDS
jgi:hypothetical protein